MGLTGFVLSLLSTFFLCLLTPAPTNGFPLYRPSQLRNFARRVSERVSEDLMLDKSKTFAQYGEYLPQWLLYSCEKLGFVHPTMAQAAALPSIFSGEDVILQAQTGSGKTLCYSLPILARVDPGHSATQSIVVVPTRELGIQVGGVLRKLSAESPAPISVMTLMEGSQNRRQKLWAVAEPPHIVVGNSKAIADLVESGRLRLNSVQTVVVDEVDASLLRPEYRQELHGLLSRRLSNTFLRPEEQQEQEDALAMRELKIKSVGDKQRAPEKYRSSRQTIFCSATIPQRNHFADHCKSNGWTETTPELINVSEDSLLPDTLEHECAVCEIDKKIQATLFLLKQEMAKSAEDFQCMIFMDAEANAETYRSHLLRVLQKSNLLPASTTKKDNFIQCLTGGMNIDARREVLLQFRDSVCRILLCSDIAARGLDVTQTSLVIQMSLPKSADDYVHRSGRTARMGRRGKVITLIQDCEEFVIKRYMNELQINMKMKHLTVKPPPVVTINKNE